MHIQVLWVNKLMYMPHTHTHPHTTAQTGNLAYAIKDTMSPGSSEAICPRCLQHAKLGSSRDSQLRRTNGYTCILFHPRGPQTQHWRLLFVGDNRTSVKGSQSRAEELEALCPVARPTGALVSSPIFKAEFKNSGFGVCSPANGVPCYRAADKGKSFSSR